METNEKKPVNLVVNLYNGLLWIFVPLLVVGAFASITFAALEEYNLLLFAGGYSLSLLFVNLILIMKRNNT